MLITSKDDSFTEGHWGYLEWRLVELAKQAARVTLTNGNDPRGLSRAAPQAPRWRREWKTADGIPYGEWENRGVE